MLSYTSNDRASKELSRRNAGMKTPIFAITLSISLATSGIAAEQNGVIVEGEPCEKELHVKADQQPLSEILVAMSDHIGYVLKFDPGSDAIVSIDRRASALTMLRELLSGKNMIAMEAPDPDCDGRSTITLVKVLPRGEDAPYIYHEPPKNAARAAMAIRPADNIAETAPPPPKATRNAMSEAEWQKMKEDYKAGKIAADPQTGKPISIEEYRRRTTDIQIPNGKSEQ
jgi:hypothetical protein